jgi:hypothetical protein
MKHLLLVRQLAGEEASLGDSVSVQYPVLFFHVQNPNITVTDTFTELSWELRHMTSQRVESELLQLLNNLCNVELTEEEDEKILRLGPDKIFLSCHYALNFGGVVCQGNSEIWRSG